MPDPSPPIATYHEVTFNLNRHFELYPDRIRVHGKILLQAEIDTTIPLNLIQPRLIKIRTRNPHFALGFWFVAAGLVGWVIAIEVLKMDIFGFVPWLFGILAFTGLALTATTYSKVEYTRFESDAGIAVIDIARAGPERKNDDAFIARLLEQIQQCRTR